MEIAVNNSTTDDAANLATTLDAISDATRAVLGNMNARGRGRKREELRLRRGPEVVCGHLNCC